MYEIYSRREVERIFEKDFRNIGKGIDACLIITSRKNISSEESQN
jgi:hypothetical protein